MEKERIEFLSSISAEIRKDIVRMIGVAGSGTVEMSLAISDLLVYLYWENMNIDPEKPLFNRRDRLIMGVSKAVPALYAVLARRGYFAREELWHYRRLGSMLQASPDYKRTPGIDAPSLPDGMELAIASSLSAVLLHLKSNLRVFCLCESNGLSEDFWDEAVSVAEVGQSNLVLLFVIKKSLKTGLSDDEKKLVMSYKDKMSNCGWSSFEIDGHDFQSMEDALSGLESSEGRPKVMFVYTNAGMDYSFVDDADPDNVPALKRREDIEHALEELEEKRSAGQ